MGRIDALLEMESAMTRHLGLSLSSLKVHTE
jgi:hypothetical protein